MPRKRNQSAPFRHPITVTIDGKEYEGTYTLEGSRSDGMIVKSAYGETTTHLSAGMTAEEWAKLELRVQVETSSR